MKPSTFAKRRSSLIALGLMLQLMTTPILANAESSDSNLNLSIKRNFQIIEELIDPAIPAKLHDQGSVSQFSSTGTPSSKASISSISTGISSDHYHYMANVKYMCKLDKERKFKIFLVEKSCGDPTYGLTDNGIDIVRGPKCSCVQSSEAYCAAKEAEVPNLIKGALVVEIFGGSVDVSSCYDCGPLECNIYDVITQPGTCGAVPTPPPAVSPTPVPTKTNTKVGFSQHR